jgi:hypothetical protein
MTTNIRQQTTNQQTANIYGLVGTEEQSGWREMTVARSARRKRATSETQSYRQMLTWERGGRLGGQRPKCNIREAGQEEVAGRDEEKTPEEAKEGRRQGQREMRP